MRKLGIIFGGLVALVLIWVGGGTVAADQAEQQVYSNTAADYFVRVSQHRFTNDGIYKTGRDLTSSQDKTPIAYSHQYAGREVHITREQVMLNGTWLKASYQHRVIGWLKETTIAKGYLRLNVPLIAQRPQLPTGCEITATTMMLQYAGANVTKLSLAREMPRSSNPNKGFVGSPYSKSGWWIYPKGLLGLVKRHAGHAVDMTGATFSQLAAKIKMDHPVVVWVSGVDGFVNHAITMTGYSKTRAYYNDPWTNRRTSMALATLQKHRRADKYRALSY